MVWHIALDWHCHAGHRLAAQAFYAHSRLGRCRRQLFIVLHNKVAVSQCFIFGRHRYCAKGIFSAFICAGLSAAQYPVRGLFSVNAMAVFVLDRVVSVQAVFRTLNGTIQHNAYKRSGRFLAGAAQSGRIYAAPAHFDGRFAVVAI